MAIPTYLLATLSPLIVAAICLFLYRRTRGDALLFWSVAHAALAVTIFIVFHLKWSGSVTASWCVAIVCGQIYGWMLLCGTLVHTGSRVTLVRGLLVSFGIGALTSVAAYVHVPWAFSLPISLNMATALASAIVLLRRRSVVNVIGSLILLVRAANSFMYLLIYTGYATALETSTVQGDSPGVC
jgi:hypothetical protein